MGAWCSPAVLRRGVFSPGGTKSHQLAVQFARGLRGGLRGGGRPSCGAASRSGGALAGGRGWSIRGAISPRAFGPRWLLARSGTGSGNAEGVGPVPRPVRTPTAQPHDKAPVRAFSALGSGDASLRAEPRRPRAAPCGRGRSAFSAFSPATDHCVGRSALFVLACVPRQVIRSEAGALAPVVPGTPQLPRTGLAQSGSRRCVNCSAREVSGTRAGAAGWAPLPGGRRPRRGRSLTARLRVYVAPAEPAGGAQEGEVGVPASVPALG